MRQFEMHPPELPDIVITHGTAVNILHKMYF